MPSAGRTLAAPLSGLLAGVPALAPLQRALGFGLVVLAVTYLSLILGELVPKRLALNSPERDGRQRRPADAGPVPAGRPRGGRARRLDRRRAAPARRARSDDAQVTEEEIRLMIRQGAEAGVFEPGEPDLVEGVLSLADRPVGELMTPRTRLVALDLDDPARGQRAQDGGEPARQLPGVPGHLDTLIGLVSVKDVWAALAARRAGARRRPAAPGLAPRDLERLARPPLYVPESLRALRLLERFRHSPPAAPGRAGPRPGWRSSSASTAARKA